MTCAALWLLILLSIAVYRLLKRRYRQMEELDRQEVAVAEPVLGLVDEFAEVERWLAELPKVRDHEKAHHAKPRGRHRAGAMA